MTRKLRDRALKVWEVYASTGPYGYSAPARIVFRCTSDALERARVFAVSGDRSDAEANVVSASVDALLEMLAKARAFD